MSDGTTMNRQQAAAIAKVIEEQVTEPAKVHVENEYALGAGDLLRVSTVRERGEPYQSWLVDAHGQVVKL